jgi:hypothetical protein
MAALEEDTGLSRHIGVSGVEAWYFDDTPFAGRARYSTALAGIGR